MFQYFSLYMPEFSSHELHTQLTSYIEFHCDWFEQIAGHFLQRQQLSVDQYIAKIAKSNVLADEVCITVLSRMLGKHTCIWLQGSTWTTGLNQRVEDCVVHLVYLGNGSYSLTRELTDDEKTKLASGQSSVPILRPSTLHHATTTQTKEQKNSTLVQVTASSTNSRDNVPGSAPAHLTQSK